MLMIYLNWIWEHFQDKAWISNAFTIFLPCLLLFCVFVFLDLSRLGGLFSFIDLDLVLYTYHSELFLWVEFFSAECVCFGPFSLLFYLIQSMLFSHVYAIWPIFFLSGILGYERNAFRNLIWFGESIPKFGSPAKVRRNRCFGCHMPTINRHEIVRVEYGELVGCEPLISLGRLGLSSINTPLSSSSDGSNSLAVWRLLLSSNLPNAAVQANPTSPSAVELRLTSPHLILADR